MTLMKHVYKSRGFAVILIISLFIQGLMASVHASAQAMIVDAPDGYTSIVICTGAGLRQITVNADGELVEEKELPMQSIYCPLCLSAAHTDFVLPNAVAETRAPITGYYFGSEYQGPSAFDRRPDNLHCLDPPSKA